MMERNRNWLERPLHPALPAITHEILIFAAIILLAIVTRFYDLGARVMSHDESLHTYFSWLLYRGQGYEHTPMMHGPFQFHIIALTYFLFGVSDFTSRIPTALFSIAIVWMAWYWRRYLGKWGALLTGFLMVISPYMLYYGRYVRNESFAAFSGVLLLYALLRHLETGGRKYIYLLVIALLLHFISKETSFIYAAEALLFLAVYFIAKVTRQRWENRETEYRAFVISLAVAIVLAGAAAGYALYTRDTSTISGMETAAPANPTNPLSPLAPPETGAISPTAILALGGVLALVFTAVYLIRGYTWARIRSERSFELLIVTGTLILPMLSPFPVKWLEPWLHVSIPTTAPEVQALSSDPRAIWVIGGSLITMFVLSALIGLIWNRHVWWKISLLFWVPYTILFTTVFTNSNGFFTGTIGSLGYWLVQQGVERGSQPWYYYTLVQIPVYEFLPALGLILAIVLGLRRKLVLIEESESIDPGGNLVFTEEKNFPNTFSLLVWWSVMTTVALSLAGERMPWLTVHIAWPMILITGWALGRIIDTTDWEGLREHRPLLTLTMTALFVVSLFGVLVALTGSNPPFQGKGLEQLQATGAFLLPFLVAILSAVGVTYLFRSWSSPQTSRVFLLTFFALLAVLTGRAAFRASYITYDQATEFLVYAHGARGIKDVIEQATEISERTTGGMGVAIAYDASAPDTGVSWPFVWYLRDFTNQRSFDQPTRSLRESVVVIVDQKNFDKIEAALGPGYYRMDYIRMWWPMQDYFNLVSDRDPSIPLPPEYSCKGALGFLKWIKSRDYSRLCSTFTDPNVRAGIMQIWLNRDYTLYAAATNRPDLALTTWQPADQMRFYVRKDVAAQIWNYGVRPTQTAEIIDPTEGKYILLPADRILDNTGENPVELNAPRSLAFAPDGTLYVADSRSHRILHLDTEGHVLQAWGSFADGVGSPALPGTFNEPWGIAIGPDGSIYVTDTWNHRVEKFTPQGKFVTEWGYFGQGETPDAFYGPRGLAVDSNGHVFVADTGNKRIVVFDSDGNFITQFGSAGMDPGLFDEPVGVAVDRDGRLYVADTWNQRIQTFLPSEDGLTYSPEKQWDVYGWFGQSLDNKPFIAVNDQYHVFITDPEGYRLMEFDPNGELLRVWGDFGDSATSFGLASGIAIDPDGHIWATDGLYNRIMRFTLP
jgi:predicted membrane-bound mannosyltransferase/DNA-binding beta-propeller fold protein YncE